MRGEVGGWPGHSRRNVMFHGDWGALTPCWAGIRSARIEVGGTGVHYLSAGEGRPGPVHLLVHPMAGSAAMWLDLIAPLSELGPVIAPDLPGTLFGHTESPHPRAAKAGPNARFLRAFAARPGIEDAVVHGWSMGALVSVLFADAAPDRVGRLVLVAPALPGPLPADEVVFWRFLGRPLLVAGAPVLRSVLRLSGRRLLDRKLRLYAGGGGAGAETFAGGGAGAGPLGGDLSRLSPEMSALLADQLRSADPRRLGDAVTALASVIGPVRGPRARPPRDRRGTLTDAAAGRRRTSSRR
ncbi:MAG: alpha/beta fold hydrolase [Streptosporangiales bacterium]|nr:alpha/beta fold hydrolase [Streptosporangiales bacterium]